MNVGSNMRKDYASKLKKKKKKKKKWDGLWLTGWNYLLELVTEVHGSAIGKWLYRRMWNKKKRMSLTHSPLGMMFVC